jgi:hypothetical protein
MNKENIKLGSVKVESTILGTTVSIYTKDGWTKLVNMTVPEIDYEELLKKYMHHIQVMEGVVYLEDWQTKDSDAEFTKEELEVLKTIENGLQ